jgi:hypothetical protein
MMRERREKSGDCNRFMPNSWLCWVRSIKKSTNLALETAECGFHRRVGCILSVDFDKKRMSISRLMSEWFELVSRES